LVFSAKRRLFGESVLQLDSLGLALLLLTDELLLELPDLFAVLCLLLTNLGLRCLADFSLRAQRFFQLIDLSLVLSREQLLRVALFCSAR